MKANYAAALMLPSKVFTSKIVCLHRKLRISSASVVKSKRESVAGWILKLIEYTKKIF
jgi:hypothetical protein